MPRLSVRVPERTLARLDAAAAADGLNRARLVRQLIERALDGVDADVGPPDTPSRDELIELLSEKARQGNVAAIRSLLAREDEVDPRQRALLTLQALAEDRQS